MHGYPVVISAALVLAWSPAGSAAMPENRAILRAVDGKAALHYLLLTVAEPKVYFRDEGLNVNIAEYPGDARAWQALVGRSPDIVSSTFGHTIVMQINTIKLQGMNPGLEAGRKLVGAKVVYRRASEPDSGTDERDDSGLEIVAKSDTRRYCASCAAGVSAGRSRAVSGLVQSLAQRLFEE